MKLRSTDLRHQQEIATPYGRFTAYYSRAGLARLDFPDEPAGSSVAVDSGLATTSVEQWHSLVEQALLAGLEGQAPAELPPLDVSGGTELEQLVWAFLQRIPPGERRSYSEVAEAIGRPQAARAVGRACGANPVPVLIPCHRVVTADGGLGGYSGGVHWKRRLLDLEERHAPIFSSSPVASID